jgi:hypothetical protein
MTSDYKVKIINDGMQVLRGIQLLVCFCILKKKFKKF